MAEWIEMTADPAHVKRERERARELRASQWWKNEIAKGRCHYCGKIVGRENLTMDHVIPVARGGTSVKSNCVPCCKDCNNAKKAKTPAEMILEKLFGEGG
ncbi:MAG: HNH endonuclease [Kiritimatiellae bacterium]|nr:HNH endonuclease [Kiritimatiellia bacterium]